MQAKATYDDARLLLELYETRREERLRRARAWFSASFKVKTVAELGALCPPASDENANYRMVVTYWEMVASFVSMGVLNKELFFQNGKELLLVWERLRDVLPGLREQQKDPFLYANLEAIGNEYAAFLERRAPGSHVAFVARVRG
jgi:hypothetical protein